MKSSDTNKISVRTMTDLGKKLTMSKPSFSRLNGISIFDPLANLKKVAKGCGELLGSWTHPVSLSIMPRYGTPLSGAKSDGIRRNGRRSK